MNVRTTPIEGVLVLEPRIFKDARGYFLETFHANRYLESGVTAHFVQDNLSFSAKGVLRGMHFQHPRAQAKLISVAQGAIFDAVVDVRLGSPTYAQWFGETLTSDNGWQLYVPEGFAHGFAVLSDTAVVTYKCSDYYAPDDEVSLSWNDPDVGIVWPGGDLTVSERDAAGLRLSQVPTNKLPRYRASDF
jgi:dTDP-4-dehydrorhamnose 3,5-epimerase